MKMNSKYIETIWLKFDSITAHADKHTPTGKAPSRYSRYVEIVKSGSILNFKLQMKCNNIDDIIDVRRPKLMSFFMYKHASIIALLRAAIEKQ